MTKQETFDRAVSGILAQGRSSVGDGVCRYRGDDGAKCAAGHLIPDALYDPKFENCSVPYQIGIVSESTTGKARIMEEIGQLIVSEGHDLLLVKALQRAHDLVSDEPDFLENFKIKAKTVATEFGLEWKY